MAAHQAPPSLGFSRQEHWSGLPFPSPVHENEKWKWRRSVMSDTLRPMDCSPPGSSAHGILQARVLEWVAIAFSSRAIGPPNFFATKNVILLCNTPLSSSLSNRGSKASGFQGRPRPGWNTTLAELELGNRGSSAAACQSTTRLCCSYPEGSALPMSKASQCDWFPEGWICFDYFVQLFHCFVRRVIKSLTPSCQPFLFYRVYHVLL